MSYVYVISCPGRDRTLYKVGMTESGTPERRLRQLQTGQPERLELVRWWPAMDAPGVERRMHALLAADHYRGEWFAASLSEIGAAYAVASGGRGARMWWVQLRVWLRLWWRRVWRVVEVGLLALGVVALMLFAVGGLT